MTLRSQFRRLFACVIATSMAWSSVAAPQVKDEVTEQARAFFEQGRADLRAGKAESARLVLERAYQLRPTPQIAFWMGLAELDMGLFVQAASHMALYMHQFSASPAEKKAFADAESNVAHLYFDVNVDRVNIHLDDEDLGHTPFVFQPVYALAGRRVIRATCEGFKPITQTYDVVAGKRTDIKLVLEKADPAPTPPPVRSASNGSQSAASTAPSVRPPPPPPPTKFWRDPRNITVGVGGVLTLAAGVLVAVEAARASSLESEANDLSARMPSYSCSPGVGHDCDRLIELREQHGAAVDLTRGALVGTAIFGTATVAAWFLWPRSRVQVTPYVAASGAWISLSGDL